MRWWLACVACSAPAAAVKPPPSNATSMSVLTAPLAGPFPDLDAYCATQHLLFCELSDMRKTDGGFDILYTTIPDSSLVGCAVVADTPRGWFVGPTSDMPCREPGYIFLGSLLSLTHNTITQLDAEALWHTKNNDDAARFTLSALCVPADVPTCSPMYISHCDRHAPVEGCLDQEVWTTWTVDHNVITFSDGRAYHLR